MWASNMFPSVALWNLNTVDPAGKKHTCGRSEHDFTCRKWLPNWVPRRQLLWGSNFKATGCHGSKPWYPCEHSKEISNNERFFHVFHFFYLFPMLGTIGMFIPWRLGKFHPVPPIRPRFPVRLAKIGGWTTPVFWVLGSSRWARWKTHDNLTTSNSFMREIQMVLGKLPIHRCFCTHRHFEPAIEIIPRMSGNWAIPKW